jgi:hypothetical protein
MKITLAVTAAAFIVTATPLLAESASAQSENLNLAQVQVAPGVEVGPGGVTVGKKHKKQRCRTVTTTEETADAARLRRRRGAVRIREISGKGLCPLSVPLMRAGLGAFGPIGPADPGLLTHTRREPTTGESDEWQLT